MWSAINLLSILWVKSLPLAANGWIKNNNNKKKKTAMNTTKPIKTGLNISLKTTLQIKTKPCFQEKYKKKKKF